MYMYVLVQLAQLVDHLHGVHYMYMYIYMCACKMYVVGSTPL